LKNEGGFADASGAVKEEGLVKAVVLGVVVEDGFEEGSGKDSPCFLCSHFDLWEIMAALFCFFFPLPNTTLLL